MNHSRTFSRRATLASLAGAALAGTATVRASASEQRGRYGRTVRFATFNASLNRATEGALVTDLSTPDNAQAQNVAETIQRVNPDILLINEFDYVAGGRAVRLFLDNYLSRGHNGSRPIDTRSARLPALPLTSSPS
jgi:3-phytase